MTPITTWLSSSSPSDKIALAASVIAIIAVVLGPAISYFIAKKQSKDTLKIAQQQSQTALMIAHQQVVAPMRQKWINDLRERVSEFLGEVAWFGGPHENNSAEVINHGAKLVVLLNQIQLMLNLKEDDHNALFKELGKVFSYSLNPRETGVHFSDAMRREAIGTLQASCAKVLKNEWERVKRGD